MPRIPNNSSRLIQNVRFVGFDGYRAQGSGQEVGGVPIWRLRGRDLRLMLH